MVWAAAVLEAAAMAEEAAGVGVEAAPEEVARVGVVPAASVRASEVAEDECVEVARGAVG